MTTFNNKQLTQFLRKAYWANKPENIKRWEDEVTKVSPNIRKSPEIWAELWGRNPEIGMKLVRAGWKAHSGEVVSAVCRPPGNWAEHATVDPVEEAKWKPLVDNIKNIPQGYAGDILEFITKYPKQSLGRWELLARKISLLAPIKGGSGENLLEQVAFTPSLSEHYKVAKDVIMETKSLTEAQNILASLAERRTPISTAPTASLKNTNGGWYHPENEIVIPAESWQHNEAVLKHPSVPATFVAWTTQTKVELKEWIDEETSDFMEAVPEGEHPEGHVIEIWADGQTHSYDELVKSHLYNQGWVKLLIIKPNSLMIEGSTRTLERYKSRIDLCVESLNGGRRYAYHEKRAGQSKTTEQVYKGLDASFRSKIANYSQTQDLER
jgi:hypothetical protein